MLSLHRQKIVTAHNPAYPLPSIIHNHRQMVGPEPIGTLENKVVLSAAFRDLGAFEAPGSTLIKLLVAAQPRVGSFTIEEFRARQPLCLGYDLLQDRATALAPKGHGFFNERLQGLGISPCGACAVTLVENAVCPPAFFAGPGIPDQPMGQALLLNSLGRARRLARRVEIFHANKPCNGPCAGIQVACQRGGKRAPMQGPCG